MADGGRYYSEDRGEKRMNDDTIIRQAAIDALTEMYCKSDEDGYVWIRK